MDSRELVDIVVFCVLSFMSIIALAIILNRYFYLRKVNVYSFETLDELENTLTKYMHLLASIGANAPYIGLLGTVLGIMATFKRVSVNSADVEAIMAGLSSALLATGLGLLVAIPSVLFYNILLREIKNKIVKWKIEDGRKRV